MTGRQGRRRRKLLDDFRKGYSHLMEEALDRTMWRARLEEALDLSQERLPNLLLLFNSKIHRRLHVITPSLWRLIRYLFLLTAK